MSVVQPESECDGVLTTEPVADTVDDPNIMTRYLRQLNRRNGRRSLGHNHVAIWNISQRFSQLQVGQQIAAKISYFEQKGSNQGKYEITSRGVSPKTLPQLPPISQSSRSAEKTRLPLSNSPVLTDDPLQGQTNQMPGVGMEMIANLVDQVDALQQALHSAQKRLYTHETWLKAMDERIQHLENENHQLKEIRDTQTTIIQWLLPQTDDSSAPSSETAAEDSTAADARRLFQQFIRNSTPPDA